MLIKNFGQSKTLLNGFDLLGSDEVALSKAFAFLIASEKDAAFRFLRLFHIRMKSSLNNYRKISIATEVHKEEGRIDIAIKCIPHFHIIIESKIRKNRIGRQRTQYLNSFDPNANRKILCFITQERDFNKQIINETEELFLGWQDIAALFDQKNFANNKLIIDYLKYMQKNYNMKQQKEILIQDLSEEIEIERFREYLVYRRPIIFGSPLYFAPYFTRRANQAEGEGIVFLSKVLGVLTLHSNQIEHFENDLHIFSDNTRLVNKWINGVQLGNDNDVYTYYFLDTPIKLAQNLLKDGGIERGRGKDWIAAQIPPNRCVTFKEFTRRLSL